jgi:hypothetical protein
MASSYSTDLKLELMVTGENAGTWGDKTNTNLNLLQQAIAGVESIALTDGGTVTLAMTDATISNARNMVLKLTGTLTTASELHVPDSIEKFYIIDATSVTGATNLTVETVSGTGFTLDQAKIYACYSDGTNVNEISLDTLGGQVANTGLVNSSITINGVAANLGSTVTIAAGTDWQSNIVTSAVTLTAGEGYFVNTTGSSFTVTLPSTPTLGDEVTIIDYAGTFDTNNLTVGRNSQPIQGTAADLVVGTERAGFSLVYTDGTQGWLLQNN